MATNEEMREHMADWPNSAAAAGRGEPGEGGRERGENDRACATLAAVRDASERTQVASQ